MDNATTEQTILKTDTGMEKQLMQSQNREVFLSIFFGAFVIVYAMKELVPLFVKWFNGESSKDALDPMRHREAVEIVLQKDLDGQYVFLGLPKLFREFTGAINGFTEQMRQLVNHQSETLKHLCDTQSETLEAIQELRSALPAKYQRDPRR